MFVFVSADDYLLVIVCLTNVRSVASSTTNATENDNTSESWCCAKVNLLDTNKKKINIPNVGDDEDTRTKKSCQSLKVAQH